MPKEILPEFIDGYKVLKKLGRGSFSNVYLVEDKYDKSKQYALKQIINPQWTAYIDQEINALNILSGYAYTPKIHHVERNQQHAYIVMDYITGTDVLKYVNKNGAFSEPQAFSFLKDLLANLTYIHSHKILHLDIKMTNIMFFKNKFCLIDWGVSSQGICVKTKNLIGGVRYLAPETYQGYRSQASDIYSLGCALYYCISGGYLFDLKKNDAIAKKFYASIYFTPIFNFPITDKLKYITLRMLEKDPIKRATIEEIENIMTGGWEIETIPDSNGKNIMPKNVFDLYQQLAKDDKHLVYAQYRLALLLEKGVETEQNIEQALYWYKKSAISGYAVAQHRLGFIFLYGKYGIKRNYKTAFYWFTKAANQEYKRSQYYLGKIYEFGKGVSQDKNKAIELYSLAMHNSDIKAEKRLKILMDDKG